MATKPLSGANRVAIWFAATFAAVCYQAGPVSADRNVTVKADQAKIVAVRGEPATVVVGNPLLADVTVREGMLVVHGRHFGTTNVLVLNREGDTLEDIELNVTRGGTQNVTMYKGGATFSYQCAPGCESIMQVGDNWDYFDVIHKETNNKYSLSTEATKLSQ